MNGNVILLVGLLLFATAIVIGVFVRLWIWPGGKLDTRRHKQAALLLIVQAIASSVMLFFTGQLWLAAILLANVPLLAIVVRQRT